MVGRPCAWGEARVVRDEGSVIGVMGGFVLAGK
jgi:hypothetical protein